MIRRSDFVIFAILFPFAAVGLAQDPVVRYTFDEIGGAALDTGSGPASNGVLGPVTGRTDNTPGNFGRALDLSEPGPDSNLFVGPTPEVDGLEEFTMTTWLYLEGLNSEQGGSGNVRLLAAQAGTANFDGFSWNLNNPNEGDRSIDNFRLGMFLGGVNGFAFGQSSEDLSAENQWVFLAVTYNGSESLDNMFFYSGGVDAPTQQLGDGLSVDAGRLVSTLATANFGIGFTDAAEGIDFAANGFQDDVRVYDRVLDEGELEVVRLENLIPIVTCDFTGDGVCDISDLEDLLNNLGGPNPTYDLDSTNPDINLGDRDAWLSLAGDQNIGQAYVTGDTDLDGDVDAGDLNNLGVTWLSMDNPGWANGDFNGDDVVNAGDLNDLGRNWQQGVAAPLAASVPEPASSTPFVVLLTLTFLGSRKR